MKSLSITSLGELKVGDYMTPQAVRINHRSQLTTAIRLMDSKRLTVLPVVDDDDHVVGMLSASDLIEITREIQADLSALPEVNEETQDFLIKLLIEQGEFTLVKDVMSAPAITIKESLNLVVAAQKMLHKQIHQFPVVDDSGHPIGILSTTDFVRAFADGAEATVK